MSLTEKAEKFLAEFEERTGAKLVHESPVSAVKVFQQVARIGVDGDAGPKTFGHLRKAVPTKPEDQLDEPMPSTWADAVYPVEDNHDEYKFRETSGNGLNGPNKARKWHNGTDICRQMVAKRGRADLPEHNGFWGAPNGTKVRAILPGVVVDVYEPEEGQRGDYWFVFVKHKILNAESGVYEYWYSGYAHNNAHHVTIGDHVDAGQHIADMGVTGTKFNHLHFSLHKHDGRYPFIPISEDFTRHWHRWSYKTSVNAGAKNTGMKNGVYLDKWSRS
jgi:hypothetical protein